MLDAIWSTVDANDAFDTFVVLVTPVGPHVKVIDPTGVPDAVTSAVHFIPFHHCNL